MRKYIDDLSVVENIRLQPNYFLLKLTQKEKLPPVLPGQFAQVRVDNSKHTFLRRPISIHNVDKYNNELWLLIQIVGEGTAQLSQLKQGQTVNLIFPLGNHFTIPRPAISSKRLLLVGGGAGVAPLFFLGTQLKDSGFIPVFLFGARSSDDLLQLNEFKNISEIHISTEDGSIGEKGFPTQHSLWKDCQFGMIYTCGPLPMMQAVATLANQHGINWEESSASSMVFPCDAILFSMQVATNHSSSLLMITVPLKFIIYSNH